MCLGAAVEREALADMPKCVWLPVLCRDGQGGVCHSTAGRKQSIRQDGVRTQKCLTNYDTSPTTLLCAQHAAIPQPR